MMTPASLLLFAGTEFVLSLTPGPAVLLVMSQGLRGGARASLLGALGIIAGNAIYFTVSALGLGALIMASAVLFYAIKWAGAAYLIYLGAKMIRESLRARAQTPSETMVSRHQWFRQGLLTQLANPKAIVFFTALLPQFIDPQSEPALQLVVLGLTSVCIEFPILVGYGVLAHQGGHLLRHGRAAPWIDRLAGTFLIGAGIKLAFVRRA
jgi:homoserine/homoserine lactone efflux protein